MPTDQERMDAYNKCIDAYEKKVNDDGIGAIVNYIAGDYPVAAYDWAKMALEDKPDCLSLLTPEQQKQVLADAAEAMKRVRDDNPNFSKNNR